MLDENEVIELAQNVKNLSQELSTVLDSFNNIQSTIGRLDVLLAYSKQMYFKDVFLTGALNSILDELIKESGNHKYSKLDIAPSQNKLEEVAKNTVVEIKSSIGTNTPKIDLIDLPTTSRHCKTNKIDTSFEYIFLNSSNLNSMNYNGVNTYVCFKNGRKYTYPSLPKFEVDKLVELDKISMAGKYFSKNIAKKYEYREASDDNEMVGL